MTGAVVMVPLAPPADDPLEAEAAVPPPTAAEAADDDTELATFKEIV